jgi:hypothetical protein
MAGVVRDGRLFLESTTTNRFSGYGKAQNAAALACAVTALAAAAGQCVAVRSSTDGYIVLPPISFGGSSAEGERWAERELRKTVCRLSWDKVGVHSPKIYCGADILDLSRN